MRLFSPIKRFLKGVREKLSGHPMIYAAIGAVGVILFWRGIWHTADFFSIFLYGYAEAKPDYVDLIDSLISAVIGFGLLLFTGLFVTDFIGTQIISSNIKTEEKMVEKTEQAERTEEERLGELESKFEEITSHLDKHLESIEKKIDQK